MTQQNKHFCYYKNNNFVELENLNSSVLIVNKKNNKLMIVDLKNELNGFFQLESALSS